MRPPLLPICVCQPTSRPSLALASMRGLSWGLPMDGTQGAGSGDARWMTYREFGQSARDQRGFCRPSGVPQGMAAPSAVVSTCDSDGRVINMLLYASHIDDLLGTELHPSW